MKSTNIFLRPLLVSDSASYQKSMDNEEIMYMTGTRNKATIEDIEKHIELITKDNTREDYAICDNLTNKMVGELSILDIDKENRLAGFRITMNDLRHTGKGLGSEAIALTIEHVFNTLELNRLQLEVYSHNPRGVKAYEKCGFKKEGVLREALFLNGKYSDEIIMAIIKSDYVS